MATPSNRVRATDKTVKRLQSLTPRTICLVFANKRRRSGYAMMADCIRPTLADSPVLSGRDQAYPIPSSKFLNPLTAANAARQYDETVAIAGLLRRNCWIADSVGYDDAVFDESLKAALVKGFRTPAGPRRIRLHGGRRPKSLNDSGRSPKWVPLRSSTDSEPTST
jgi:hypothetical protein